MGYRAPGFQQLARGLNSCGSQALEHRFNSRGTQALLLCTRWDLPESEIEPIFSEIGRQILCHWATRETLIQCFVLNSPFSCLLRNLYVDQKATVKTRHGKTDWFKIGKGVHQACILSPYFLNLYSEYIMWNAGLDEAQAGIKISRRNINNLRYADDSTLMAEREEELKSLLKVKEKSEKSRLKTQHSKN